MGRGRLQGREYRAGSSGKFYCLTQPCETGLPSAVNKGSPSLQSRLTLCKPLPRHPQDRGAPGPKGNLWRNESACDLEFIGPAKGITMRKVTRQSVFDVPNLGNWWCQKTQKSQMVFSRVMVHRGEKPRAPFTSFSKLVSARVAGVGGREVSETQD